MSHSARDLAARRAHVPHTSMFLRMLVRAAVLRRGRAVSALFAMIVAAAVATAMTKMPRRYRIRILVGSIAQISTGTIYLSRAAEAEDHFQHSLGQALA